MQLAKSAGTIAIVSFHWKRRDECRGFDDRWSDEEKMPAAYLVKAMSCSN